MAYEPVRCRNTLTFVSVLLVTLAGCATPQPAKPTSMRDPTADFAAYKTFGWAAPSGASAQPLSLLDQNLRAAIAAELQRRGYAESPDKPDLRIAYEAGAAEKLESNPVRIGVGVGSWGSNVGGSVNVGSPSVRKVKEGSLVIHAVDAARNAEVWQGSLEARLGKGSADRAAINSAVATVMRDFPARQ